jgi:hypothetical protein
MITVGKLQYIIYYFILFLIRLWGYHACIGGRESLRNLHDPNFLHNLRLHHQPDPDPLLQPLRNRRHPHVFTIFIIIYFREKYSLMAAYFDRNQVPQFLVNKINRFYSYFYEDNGSHPEFKVFFERLNNNLEKEISKYGFLLGFKLFEKIA